MKSETKQCQNCKKDFIVEPDDFLFYEKIKVPPPTFCPECRNQRRMSWRNERSLYKRKCSAPKHNEEVISMYDPKSPYVIFDNKYWWSDEWNPTDYGLQYDFQHSILLIVITLILLMVIKIAILSSVQVGMKMFVMEINFFPARIHRTF